MTDRELMEMALDALENYMAGKLGGIWDARNASDTLRERLAQPDREWVGLTDDEIYDYADKFLYQHGSNYGIKSFAKAIEAKPKEKNT